MNKRPLAVTIISWFLIVSAGIALVSSLSTLSNSTTREFMAQSPVPLNIQYLMIYAGMAVSLVCGIAMLKRQNWARILYIAWSVIGFIYSIATLPMKALLLPSLIIFLIVAFFLFRPNANEYFRATAAAKHGS